MKGILGKKVGMTQVFTSSGKLVPVTVIEVEPNVVTQIKTKEQDGYNAIQLGTHTVKEKSSNKAKIGHIKKANSAPKRFLREIRGARVENYELGQVIDASMFTAGEVVDVQGISKGKGTQGPIKRHNQSRGPMSHGSQYHRGVGSLGSMRAMRVLKGKKMAGRMGNELTTIQNLEVVSVDLEHNVILIKGNVPGPKKSLVMIKTSVKKGEKINSKAEELLVYELEEEIVEEVVNEVVEESVEKEETAEEAVEATPEESAAEEKTETTEEEPVQEETKETPTEETVEEADKE